MTCFVCFKYASNQRCLTKNDIFIFHFNDNDTNFEIDLKDISEYSNEKEVLIMPGISFRITKIKHGNTFQIELEQLIINHLLGKKEQNLSNFTLKSICVSVHRCHPLTLDYIPFIIIVFHLILFDIVILVLQFCYQS